MWLRLPGKSRVGGGGNVRRWSLQIYGKVTARTKQWLNPDGPRCGRAWASTVTGRVKAADGSRAPELYGFLKKTKKTYEGPEARLFQRVYNSLLLSRQEREHHWDPQHMYVDQLIPVSRTPHSALFLVYLQRGRILLCLGQVKKHLYVTILKKMRNTYSAIIWENK